MDGSAYCLRHCDEVDTTEKIFSDAEIREFQRDADRFGRIFIKLLGAEAVGTWQSYVAFVKLANLIDLLLGCQVSHQLCSRFDIWAYPIFPAKVQKHLSFWKRGIREYGRRCKKLCSPTHPKGWT